MKTASAGLIALLNAQLFCMADLFKFTLVNRSVLYYTSGDGDLVYGGHTYSAVNTTSGTPALTRGRTRAIIGIEVDTLEINFLVNSTVLVNSLPLAQFAANGGFDGARLELDRAFMPVGSYGDTSAGVLVMFVGRVAEVECTRTAVRMNVNSDLELLNVRLPRNVYQAGCRHSLYDAGCTLSKATFTVASAAAAGSTTRVINSALAQAVGYFDLGVLTFTSGVNSGLSRTVKSYAVGIHTLSFPFPVAPTIGDTFTTYPGCDKQRTTCDTKYGNLVNFGGFPYIPVPETAY